jgi:hypothetical protein
MGAVWNQRCGRRTDLVFELTTEQRTVGFRAALPEPPSKLIVASGGRGPISQMIITTTTRAMTNAMLVYRSIGATQFPLGGAAAGIATVSYKELDLSHLYIAPRPERVVGRSRRQRQASWMCFTGL